MSEWQAIYISDDQTIEQRTIGDEVEQRTTWHRETPERLIEQLRGKVADLEAQATGKITKSQLVEKLAVEDKQEAG